MFFQLIFILLPIFVYGDCNGKSSVIINGTEYRLFFDHRENAKKALEKCKHWGNEWKSTTVDADLIKEIGQDLQICLKEMIMSNNVRIWKHGDRKELGYFIGGGIDSDIQQEWRWHKGGSIPLSEEDGFQKWAGRDEPIHKPSSNRKVSQDRCMSALLRGNDNGLEPGDWVDQDCTRKMYYVCQRVVPKELVWGFSENDHAVPPQEWSTIEDNSICNGQRQSPVNIQKTLSRCSGEQVSTPLRWGSNPGTKIQWKVKNTGRMIRIEIIPKRALFLQSSESSKKYVDYMQLKWGSNGSNGSEHTIDGIRHAGELQVFHEPDSDGNVHALAFMLQQRSFQSNNYWQELLTHILRSQKANTSSTMTSPNNHILSLLNDSAKIIHYDTLGYRISYGFRYEGSLTHPPCTENVIWTVYPRPISLSLTQFTVLRKLHMEGKSNSTDRYITQTTREIQDRHDVSFCRV